MRRISLTLASLLLITQAGMAQEVKRLSMKDCMEYAVTHNYTVKNAKLDVEIQKAQNNQTVSAAYPHINGKVDLSYFDVPQSQFIDASTFPSTDPTAPKIPKGTIVPISFSIPWAITASATASQVIFDGGVLVALQARRSVLELAQQNSLVSEETVRYNVYKAYNSIVIAYRQYDILKQSIGYARSLQHDIIVTKENGFAEKIDVERTNVQLNNLITDSIRIGNILTVTEQVLKYQMGMDINTPIVLTDTSLTEDNPNMLSLISEPQQYDRIPQFNVLQTSLRLNQYNLKRYQNNAYPTLSAFWNYGNNYGSLYFKNLGLFKDYATFSIFGVSLNVPVFNGFLRKNQVAEARLNIEKNKNNIEYMKQSLDFMSAQSRTTLRNNILQAQSQKRNMELAGSVLDLAQRKYKAGVGSNIEVTQAQTDLLRAQNNYFAALLDVVNAEADLKKALGIMTTNNVK